MNRPQASSSLSLTGPPRSHVKSKPAVHDVAEEEKGQVEDIEILLESLNSTIGRYEKDLQKKMLDDIYKRLDSFMAYWKDGKLSQPVKAAMTNLADALAADDYDKVD